MPLSNLKLNTISLLASAIALNILTIIIPLPPAQASLYRSTNGGTEIRMPERNATRVDRLGSYSTRIGNQTWNGSFKVNVDGGLNNLLHRGTFEDSPAGNSQIKCTGTIEMNRQSLGRTPGLTMTVVWTTTGGNQCPSIGKTFRMVLPEALPVANAQGDYRQAWGRWQVVSADGKLNCRATPNGTVIHTFKQGEEIVLDGRLNPTITINNGRPWLYVPYVGYPYSEANYKPCYVRANSQYISPNSLSF
jgi:hypothetical protein